MDGSGSVDNARPQAPVEAYEGPVDHRTTGRHAAFPDLAHDETERFNYLAQMNRYISARVATAVEPAWEARGVAKFEAEHGRKPKDRHEVRKALASETVWQLYSALRRATMEQRQEAGRWLALRQAENLAAKVAAFADDRLELDPGLPLPRYVTAVDHHCAPGSYHTERFPGDVSGPASYDSGIYVTLGGKSGPWNEGIGQALADWVRKNRPDFHPKRILDLGATVGHNVVPIARAFPEAEIVAVDLGAPVLRYGAARTRSLGIDNVRFVQADATDLSRYPDGSFDWVQTTMFLHELSLSAMRRILKEARRLLAPGGLLLNMEQPAYSEDMPLVEQAMRDWDSFNNNEPFWTTLHGLKMDEEFIRAGFDRGHLIDSPFLAPPGKDGRRRINMVFHGATV